MNMSLKQHENGWAELSIKDYNIEYRKYDLDNLLYIAQVRDKKLVVEKNLLSLFSERALPTIPLYLVNGRAETLNKEPTSSFTFNGKSIEIVGHQGLGFIHEITDKGFEISGVPTRKEANTSDAKKVSLLGSGNIYKFGDWLVSDGVNSTSAIVNSDVVCRCSVNLKSDLTYTCVKHLIDCNIQSKEATRLLKLGKAVTLLNCKLSNLEVDLTNCYSMHNCLFDNCLIVGSPSIVGAGTMFKNCSMRLFRSGTAMLYGTHIKEGE